jgi:flagella basal body P-ring formation protein FlgA
MAGLKTAGLMARGAVATIAAALSALPVCAADGVLPVPKVVIYPGELINDSALVEQAARAVPQLPVVTKREDAVGKVARRTLVPGRPIPLNAIRVPDAVAQGKTYRVQFAAEGLVISSYAVALTSGAVGEVVSLRNPESGNVVRGVVRADGTVRLGQP